MGSSNSADRSQWTLSQSEKDRLNNRPSNNQLFKKIKQFSSAMKDEEARVPHCCYLHLIGIIPNFEQNLSENEFQSEMIECTIDRVKLYEKLTLLIDKRKEYAIFEDSLAPKLMETIQQIGEPSFAVLREACSTYERDGDMERHNATAQQSFNYFLQKNIDHDEAFACAFAIAFYTGSYSETVNQSTALVTRSSNDDDILPTRSSNDDDILLAWSNNDDDVPPGRRNNPQASINAELSNITAENAIIIYYLIKGLSYIEFYWGIVTRCVQLDDNELKDYQIGALITWFQFSSSNRGSKPAEWFTKRNTIFHIYSLTGRSIRNFSNCADDEDEVLFLPHSSFLVCRREIIAEKSHIYLRQVELGLSKYVVLWVDDHIFDDWWENKEHMEEASTLGANINVHFIPKSNTDTALAFLRSEFGQRLKRSQSFRFVTDMNRDNETPSDNAGARFLFEIRQLQFTQPCLIFTSNANEGRRKLAANFQQKNIDGIEISENTKDSFLSKNKKTTSKIAFPLSPIECEFQNKDMDRIASSIMWKLFKTMMSK